jgi:tRNA(Arg) A34 adenosine deaminase TadA
MVKIPVRKCLLKNDKMNTTYNEYFLLRAIELANANIKNGTGGPFGAVVVKDGAIIAESGNTVTCDNDPTAHAEVNVIRAACKILGHFQLEGCQLYTSCEPCPMCLGAIYWARPDAVYYAATQKDAAHGGFDDAFIYHEINKSGEQRTIPFIGKIMPEGKQVFENWLELENKINY